MTAIKGSLIKIKQGDGGDPTEVFTTVVGSRNVSGTINGNTIDITSADDISAQGVAFRNRIPSIVDFEISVEALIKDKTTFNGLIDDALTGVSRNYQVEIEGMGTFEGPLGLDTQTFSGQFDDAATYSLSFSARGVQVYTPAP